MAAPPLKLKRGTAPTAVPNTVAGEPIVRYNSSITELYIGDDGATTSKLVADSGATSAANEILTKFTVESADGAADGVNASVKLTSMDVTGAAVTIDVPDAVAADYSFTLPDSAGTNGFVLQTDGSGNTSWVAQTSGFSGFDIAADTGTAESVASTDTVTFTGGTGIDTTVSATNTITIAIDNTVATLSGTQTLSNKTLTTPQINDGLADHQYIFAVGDLAADRTVTLPVLTADDTFVFANFTQALTNKSLQDSTTSIIDEADGSKVLKFECSGITTGTTRTLTAPNASGTIALTTSANGVVVESVAATANAGITIGGTATAPTVGLTGAGSLTTNDLLKWNGSQLVDSSITDDGTTVTINGNFTVTGTTTTASVETTNTQITDALIELANGATAATLDAGLIIERGTVEDNVFIGFDEGLDVFVAGTTTITGAGSDASPTPIAFLALELQVNDDSASGGSAGNETVIGYLGANGLFSGSAAGRYLQNVTIDCGEY